MKTLTFQNFAESLENILPNYSTHNFLIAVSGGADSMALLHLATQLQLNFHVAHVNYNLRGNDSLYDKELVERFCTNKNITFHVHEVSKDFDYNKVSLQTYARDLRYDFFKMLMNTHSIDYLITAHHLNDELETFIINLSRGSGIKGLSGIPSNENSIIRPLLSYSKKSIYNYCNDNIVEFREDISNSKNEYLRNKIRNKITPLLTEVNDKFLENFEKSISILNDTQKTAFEYIDQIRKSIENKHPDYITINRKLLSKQNDFVAFEILNTYGFNAHNEIKKIQNAEVGKHFASKTHFLTVDRNHLVIIHKKNKAEVIYQQHILCESIIDLQKEEKTISINQFKITLEIIDVLEKNEKMKSTWFFDLDKVSFPISIRNKKDDDVIYPTGMRGKKKISKFFKDEKIPILAQSNIWILCDGKDNTLGILPKRQDKRNLVTDTTNHILKIIFSNTNNEY